MNKWRGEVVKGGGDDVSVNGQHVDVGTFLLQREHLSAVLDVGSHIMRGGREEDCCGSVKDDKNASKCESLEPRALSTTSSSPSGGVNDGGRRDCSSRTRSDDASPSQETPPFSRGGNHPREYVDALNKSVQRWSQADVAWWLSSLGMSEAVCARFEAQKVTGEVLLTLTEKDFKDELDVQLLGERRCLTLAITLLQKQSPTSSFSHPLPPTFSPTSASPATTSSSHPRSPQHSPVTHHHYYHHHTVPPPPPPPPPAYADRHSRHHQQQHHQSCHCFNRRGGGGGDANGGDSGVGGVEGKRVWCGRFCSTPAVSHHQELRQHVVRRRGRTRRNTQSSDDTDDEDDDDVSEVEDMDDVDDVDDVNMLPGGVATVSAGLDGAPEGGAANTSWESVGGMKRGGGVVAPGGVACGKGVGAAGGGGRATSRLQPEYLKTAISCFYMFLVTWITAIVMVFVHDRVPDRARHPPLPDIFLDNVPHIPWAFQLCEVTIIVLTTTLSIILCFHRHRCIILRRFAALSGTVFLLRCATMFITSLSVPGTHLQCSPREPRSVWRQVEQAWLIWQGGGLSIKGVRTCGDYMFSGHTTALTMLNFFITEYTPRRMYYIHISSWVLNMFGVFFVLAAHEHYSIDVFIAFYITSRMFLYYHSLANNRALHQRDSFRTKVWFPMFSYFESSIDRIVPNEYENLFSQENLLWGVRAAVRPCLCLAGRVKVTLLALSGVAGWREQATGRTMIGDGYNDSTSAISGGSDTTAATIGGAGDGCSATSSSKSLQSPAKTDASCLDGKVQSDDAHSEVAHVEAALHRRTAGRGGKNVPTSPSHAVLPVAAASVVVAACISGSLKNQEKHVLAKAAHRSDGGKHGVKKKQ